MRAVLVLGLVAALAVAGCGAAVTQSVSTVTGATPRYYEVKDLGGPMALDTFRAVGVEPFDASALMGKIPPAAVPEAQALIAERLSEMRVFDTVTRGAPPAGGLLIRGRFVDYDSGGSALRAVGFGVNPFLTAQIEVIDTGTNTVLGIAMVTGTVKSAVRTGTKELADGVAKAVKGLFERHHSKPPEKATGATPAEPAPAKKGFKWPWSK
jgi:hypothetical protein